MEAATETTEDLPAQSPAQAAEFLRQRVLHLEQEITRARHDACHDPLTGLPNRTLLFDRLKQAVVQTARQHKTVGLLLIDLDGFKDNNDQLGHDAGDFILQQVARRLLDSVRDSDTVCRYGGDEFVVMLPEIDVVRHASQLRTVVRKIRASLAAPYSLQNRGVGLRASIGTAVLEDGDLRGSELIRTADAQMYREKRLTAARPRPARTGLAQPRPEAEHSAMLYSMEERGINRSVSSLTTA
jgi:diguanylate cyclase